jgi:hypothetical protein
VQAELDTHAAEADALGRQAVERARRAAAAALTNQIKNQIHSLATDFHALWSNPHTPQRDRVRMVRLPVDDVTLHKTDRIHLQVRLRGGPTRGLTIAIPPTSWQPRQPAPTPSQPSTGCWTPTDAEAADALNTDGHRCGENKPVHRRHRRPRLPQLRYAQPSHPPARPRSAHHNRTRTTPRSAPQHLKSWTKAGILRPVGNALEFKAFADDSQVFAG